jgi:hypothetical protein
MVLYLVFWNDSLFTNGRFLKGVQIDKVLPLELKIN